jgi:hypothetical protein
MEWKKGWEEEEASWVEPVPEAEEGKTTPAEKWEE